MMSKAISCLPFTFISCIHANKKFLLERLYLAHEIRNVFDAVLNACWSLFLFTKSDFKTIILPVFACVFATCPDLRPSNMLMSLLWTWLHLLQFCTSNQTLSVDEDAANKPWRPVPSGRISLATAKTLRRWLVPLCLVYSAQQDVLLPSVCLNIMTFIHNELGFHSGWMGRNICCALGYMAFEWGAISIASSSQLQNISTQDWTNVVCAIALSGILLLTTIHAQDFKDVVGDRIHDRKTLPIAMPNLSRISLLVAMTAWSLFLPRVWDISFLLSSFFGALGLLIGSTCFACRSVKSDQVMYMAYNFWLGWALILPSLGSRYHLA